MLERSIDGRADQMLSRAGERLDQRLEAQYYARHAAQAKPEEEKESPEQEEQ